MISPGLQRPSATWLWPVTERDHMPLSWARTPADLGGRANRAWEAGGRADPGDLLGWSIAHGAAAAEIADAMGPVVGRGQPDRPFAFRPGAAVDGPDGQPPELVEGEAATRVMTGHVLDPIQLGVPVRVGGLLLGPGALEADPVSMQNCRSRSRPIRADRSRPAKLAAGSLPTCRSRLDGRGCTGDERAVVGCGLAFGQDLGGEPGRRGSAGAAVMPLPRR